MDFFYRKKPWYAGQFVRKIIPKFKVKEKDDVFFTTLLNQQKKKLLSVLVRNVDNTFLESNIQLPTKNNKIDFDFMESFIAELEAERINKLEAYLTATGLKDYTLTDDEKQVLNNYEKLEWGRYKIDNLFEKIKTKKLPYNAEELPKQAVGKYTLPCLTSSFNNQGLNYYAPKEGATILQNVISIPSNSDVYRAYFQPNDFTVLSDAYAIKWIYDNICLSQNSYLFIVLCINKVTDLPIYSYKNKLGGWNVVKNKYIQLPTKNEKPDYATMELLISAIKKMYIRDVVLYADNKIEARKQVTTKI